MECGLCHQRGHLNSNVGSYSYGAVRWWILFKFINLTDFRKQIYSFINSFTTSYVNRKKKRSKKENAMQTTKTQIKHYTYMQQSLNND